MPAKFSKSEAIKYGWSVMKANFLFFLGLMLAIVAVNIVTSSITGLFEKVPFVYFILTIAFMFVGFIMNLGLLKIVLKFYDKQKPSFADLYRHYRLVLKFFLASIVVGFAVVVGLILFILPGIYLGIKLQFFSYFIVDKKMGSIEAIKASWAATSGSFWNLFLFALLCLGVNILGLMALGIGLLLTLPTTMMAIAYVYCKLSGGGAVVSKPAFVVPAPAAAQPVSK